MDQKFDEAVKRLEKERSELWNKWEESGRAGGTEWALQASYAELEEVVFSAKDHLERGDDLPAGVGEIVKEERAFIDDLCFFRDVSTAAARWEHGWLSAAYETGMALLMRVVAKEADNAA